MVGAQRSWLLAALAALSALLLPGCGAMSVATRNSVAGITATTVAAHIPTTDIHQVYYLGVFDPRDQLPPTIYRVRVRGQASALNLTRFASGWVRAELIDSLSGQVELPGDTKTQAHGKDTVANRDIERGALTGRRLVMFGPEGFREAPRNHRLVVVMGSSPEKFFSAVDEALGVVAQVTQGGSGPEIEKALWSDLSKTRLLRQRVDLVVDAAHGD